MRVVVVWKDYTDYSREVISWLREFEQRTGRTLESLDPDTIPGETFAKAYDIVQYPTVIAITEPTGIEQKRWVGTPMPLIDEVSFYN
ncbi:MAG: hypothetical protein LBT19_01330 [Candidatus Nomurabacteria bacterium]|jgi:hypothetical protein|nr:hypothetical protein [Candidatus Nomurabacteria bacterium]